jgi:hypothetical protein
MQIKREIVKRARPITTSLSNLQRIKKQQTLE